MLPRCQKKTPEGQHHSAQTLYVVQPGQTGVRHTPWPSPSTAMRPGALEKAIASISGYSRKARNQPRRILNRNGQQGNAKPPQ